MRARRLLVLGVLVIWTLAGPLAAVFGGCAVMCVMSDAPCAIAACPAQIQPNLSVMPLIATLSAVTLDHPPAAPLFLLEPPPKSSLAA